MTRGTLRAADLRRAAASALLGAALWMATGSACAEVVALLWQDDGRFERSLTIAPGKFAEICGPFEPGQTVQWSFKADRAVNFNIHYHLDKDLRYPAKADQTKRLKGFLAVDAKQDYCWMWVNKSTTTTKLRLDLTRK